MRAKYQNKNIKISLTFTVLYPSIFQNFPVSAILEDTGHCQNMSIVDTGRFWEILVIPVLQILEDSGK
jgi:DNA polymerase elongation subunit (family B)